MADAPTETPATDAPAEAAPAHPLLRRLAERFGAGVLSTHEFRGDATAIVDRASFLDVCRFLREDPELDFDLLLDVTAVDYFGRKPRFEAVYHLVSVERGHRLRIKVGLEEDDAVVPSLVPIWPGADWLERETYDMYGIRFDGHPNLKRIYLYEQFEGHPLRKDYPKEKRQPLIGPGAVHRDPMNDDLTR